MRGAIQRLIDRGHGMLTRGDFRPAVVKLVSGTTLGRLAIVAVSPLITRIFAPTEVGEYAAALAVMGILMAVADLNYHASVGLPERDGDAANVVAVSLVVAVGFGLLIAFGLSATNGTLLAFLGLAALFPHVPLIIAGQILGNIAMTLTFWTTRMRQFGTMAFIDMSESFATAGAQIALGLLGMSVAGLFGGWILGAAVAAGGLAYTAWRSKGAAFAQVAPRRMWSMAKRYRRFAFMTTPSVLMNTVGLRAPLLLLLAVYGTEVGGQYALAERVALLPVTLMAGAVAQVYYAHAAPLARRQDDALKGLFLRTTRTLALYAIVPMALAAVIAPFAFGILFGQDWIQAGIFAASLAPWFYVTLLTNPTGRTLDVLERQDLHLTREVLRLTVLGVAALFIIVVHPPPVGAVLLLTVAGCITYGLYGYISWRAIVSDRPRRGVPPAGSAPLADSPADLP